MAFTDVHHFTSSVCTPWRWRCHAETFRSEVTVVSYIHTYVRIVGAFGWHCTKILIQNSRRK